MSRAPLTICYLTKKPNAIVNIAARLRPAFPVLAAQQVSSIDDIPANKTPDILIADEEFKDVTVNFPILYVINAKNAPASPNFITEEELSTHALSRAVMNILEQSRLVKELKEASIKDELTGLYNQKFLLEVLAKEVKKGVRHRKPLTILCIGLDNIREINSRHGYKIGDRAIVDFGLLIANSVRDIDTVGRLVGDEFLAILPETGSESSANVCSRIQRSAKNFAFAGGEAGLNVTACIGIASLTHSIRTKDSLLEAVRSALSAAKRRGAGSTCTAEEACLVKEPLKENKELILSIQHNVAELTDETKKAYLGSILKIFEELPIYSRIQHHADHTAFYAERLALKTGVSAEDALAIRFSALFHDIGLSAIDERVVFKQGHLDSAEFALIKTHPLIAAQMLERSAFIKNEVNIILHHHERFDGSGYPDHLAGTHIPFASRIITLAEAWDTMISKQSYRDAMPLDIALKELKKGAGTQFDPELVGLLTGLIEN